MHCCDSSFPGKVFLCVNCSPELDDSLRILNRLIIDYIFGSDVLNDDAHVVKYIEDFLFLTFEGLFFGSLRYISQSSTQ